MTRVFVSLSAKSGLGCSLWKSLWLVLPHCTWPLVTSTLAAFFAFIRQPWLLQRIEAVASTTRGVRLDPGDAVLKGPQRLGKTMLETNLALPLLIQVAQQRKSCVFKAPDAHLKSLASLFDTVSCIMLCYTCSHHRSRLMGSCCNIWICLLRQL